MWANRVLIRADVQFFRQDFSITLPTGGDFRTAGGLRFDFLVRTRPVTAAAAPIPSRKSDATYPQREAALFALRSITGQDAGTATESWLKLYPDAHAEAEGQRMSAALRQASAEHREQLLVRYREAKDERTTVSLAHTIPHVTPQLQKKVRAVLVERLARLSADELRAQLEGDGELHRAAAQMYIRKADATMLPELIQLLTDAELEVADAAHDALRKLTGEDFGPAKDCQPEQREAAAALWLDWYRKNAS